MPSEDVPQAVRQALDGDRSRAYEHGQHIEDGGAAVFVVLEDLAVVGQVALD